MPRTTPSRTPAPVLIACLGALIAAAPVRADGPKPVAPPERYSDEQKGRWAFQPPRRTTPPEVKERAWVRNPIDGFILAGLEEVDFRHAAEADKVALVRRVTFDLTGLPPTPEAVETYSKDDRPDAYDRLVDRLLASPAYGERWAQHWLDLAHYADTNGFELDAERPDAWRYRDWVVGALNADLPFDRFVSLQLAGDEVEPGDAAALIATGFGRCGPREVVGGNIDPAVRRQSELTEVTSTVGSVFLGLTFGCARCHDHKFDPIPTTDFYRLQSFFAAAALDDVPIAAEADRKAFEAAKDALDVRLSPLRQRLSVIEAPYRKALRERKQEALTPAERAVLATPADRRTPTQKRLAEGVEATLTVKWEEVAEAVAANPADHAERERLKREVEALSRTLPRPPAHACALADDSAKAPETYVARRGDLKQPGPRVEPRPPGVLLASMPSDAFRPEAIRPGPKSTGRRAALAAWLTRPDNPLTARVIVNRLWQHHFGRGIVATPGDFGVRGEPPSHPELLDWLAAELVADGWRLKPLHRLMVTSAAYRQASTLTPAALARRQAEDDPENALLSHMNRHRMEAESLRDAMLAVAGGLNPKAGGPGVLPPIEQEVEDLIFTEAEVVDLWPATVDPSEHLRRSLYLYRKRNVRYPLFDAFDAPDTQSACPVRAASTHALQALVLLNSEFALARARDLAARVRREAGTTDARVARLYRLALARPPRPSEVERARDFLGAGAAEADAWVDFALAMLNSNEFLYVP